MSSRLGTRALPPRSPKDTKPSFVGQISRVRPMLAPRRAPRKPVCWNRAGRAHVGAEHGLLHRDRSTRWGRPVQQRGDGGERGLGAGVRVPGRLGAAHRRAVGVAGAVHVGARRHHAEVGLARQPARGSDDAERRDAAPTLRAGARRRVERRACPGSRGCRARCRPRRGARPAPGRRARTTALRLPAAQAAEAVGQVRAAGGRRAARRARRRRRGRRGGGRSSRPARRPGRRLARRRARPSATSILLAVGGARRRGGPRPGRDCS